MTDEELEAIRLRYAHYGATEKLNKNTAVHHIRLLMEEVARLQGREEECPYDCGSCHAHEDTDE